MVKINKPLLDPVWLILCGTYLKQVRIFAHSWTALMNLSKLILLMCVPYSFLVPVLKDVCPWISGWSPASSEIGCEKEKFGWKSYTSTKCSYCTQVQHQAQLLHSSAGSSTATACLQHFKKHRNFMNIWFRRVNPLLFSGISELQKKSFGKLV